MDNYIGEKNMGINTPLMDVSSGPCRESSQTIIERRVHENRGRAELYTWLLNAMSVNPMSKDCEEQLWNMLIRERPY